MTFDMRIVAPLVALLLAPFLTAVDRTMRAWLERRRGAPLLQDYFDLAKLVQKVPAVRSDRSWLSQAGPIVALASTLSALFLIPLGNLNAPIAMSCDVILIMALLSLSRFSMLLASLDSGDRLEDPAMHRIGWFFVWIEPVLVLSILAVSRVSGGQLSLSLIHANLTFRLWSQQGLSLSLAAIALALVTACETASIRRNDSVEQPKLELSNAILLQHLSGPDLALARYAVMLQQWILGLVFLNVVLPSQTHSVIPIDFISTIVDLLVALSGLFFLTVTVSWIEAKAGRLSSRRIPQVLIGATAIAVLALALTIEPSKPF